MNNLLLRNMHALLAAFMLTLHSGFVAADTDIEQRTANIMSEGVRMHADIYHPKSPAGKALPTIIMSHGWGGTASLLRTQAMDFAAAGYFVIAFDYRGWGNSDSRVILTKAAPSEKTGQRFVAEVKEVREVVDPLDQGQDILNVVHWAAGETMVDQNRIGLWGTSFSGGLVAYVAARDARVRAFVSQVGFFGRSKLSGTQDDRRMRAFTEGTKRARGELPYPAPRAREVGNLQGGPIREKFLHYDPIDDMAKIKHCAALFIAAENEELFDNKDNPELAYQRAAEPKQYVVIPNIAHYGVYSQARVEVTKLAVEWLDRYLKQP